MQLNLKTLHKPETLAEAVDLLKTPGTYPLYGGAALQRNPRPEVEAAVDLSRLDLDYVRDSENSLRLGAMLTLEQVREICAERGAAHPRLGAIADMLRAELPETQRHTFTLGDLLVERNPQSPTLTLLLALGGVLKRLDVEMHLTMAAWLGLEDDVARILIGQLRVTRGPQDAVVAYEKVARTPADLPIVGAVAYGAREEDGQRPYLSLALCGVGRHPLPQPDVARVLGESGDIDAALDHLQLDPPDDHWGSAAYRAEMARVTSRRALQRVLDGLQ